MAAQLIRIIPEPARHAAPRYDSDPMEALIEFLHMGGYAFYVWWSYAIVAALLALNIAVPLARARRQRRRLKRLAEAAGESTVPTRAA